MRGILDHLGGGVLLFLHVALVEGAGEGVQAQQPSADFRNKGEQTSDFQTESRGAAVQLPAGLQQGDEAGLSGITWAALVVADSLKSVRKGIGICEENFPNFTSALPIKLTNSPGRFTPEE